MALEMKNECGRCEAALEPDEKAFICVFECTFCPDCADEMDHLCENCGGELVRRPRHA